MGPEYPGEGAAQTTVAGSIIDDFCIIQAKITLLGLLLVPIHRDTLTNLKTETGGMVKKRNKKIENQGDEEEEKGDLSTKENGTAKTTVPVSFSA